MRFKKTISIIVTILFCLLLIYLDFKIFLSPEQIKRRAEENLQDYFNTDVIVRKASFNIIEGVKIKKILIRSIERDKNIDFFRVNEVHIKLNTIALLLGKIKIEKIELKKPEIFLEQFKDGNWNFSYILKKTKKGEGITEFHRPELIKIKDGKINLRNFPLFPEKYRLQKLTNLDCEIYFPAKNVVRFKGIVENDPNWGFLFIRGEKRLHNKKEFFNINLHNVRLRSSLKGRLAKKYSELIERFSPLGTLHIEINLQKDINDDAFRFMNATINPEDCSVYIKQIGFRIEEVKGTIEIIKDKINFEKLEGKRDKSLFTLTGNISGLSDEAGLNLKIQTKNFLIEKRLKNNLDETMQKVWDFYKPRGLADAILLIKKPKGKDKRLDWDLTARCKDFSITYLNFPYEVSNITAKVKCNPDGLQIIDAIGYHKNSKIMLSAKTKGLSEKCPLHVDIEAENVPFDEDFKNALDKNVPFVWTNFKPKGMIEKGIITVHKEREDSIIEERYDIRLKNTDVLYKHFKYQLNNVNGRLIIGSNLRDPHDMNGVRLKDVKGTHGEGKVKINGYVESFKPEGEFNIRVTGENISLDDDLKKALPKNSQRSWEQFDPKGIVDLDCNVEKAKGKDKKVLTFVNIRPKNMQVKYVNLKYPVSEIKTGEIKITPTKTSINDVSGKRLSTTVTLNRGSIHRSGKINLNFDINKLRLDDIKFFKALPKEVQEVFKFIKPKGICNIKNLTIGIKPGIETNFKGNLELKKVDLDPGIELKNVVGKGMVHTFRLFGKKKFKSDNVELVLQNLNILTKEVTVSSKVTISNDILFFDEIKGKAYEGDLKGWFLLMFKEGANKYTGEFSVKNMDLTKFGKGTFKQEKEFSGVCDAEIKISGSSDSPQSLRGIGKIYVKKAKLWDVPLFLILFNLFYVGLPKKPEFDAGEMDFNLKGQKIIVNKLTLESSAVIIGGKGEIGFDGKLDLEMYVKNVGNIPILDRWIGWVVDNIVSAHMTGTISKPVGEPRILNIITNPIKKLLELFTGQF